MQFRQHSNSHIAAGLSLVVLFALIMTGTALHISRVTVRDEIPSLLPALHET